VHFPAYLLLPLGSAVFYSLSAIIFKKEMGNGANPWLINFFSNVATCILTIPLLLVHRPAAPHLPLALPLLASIVFMIGQITSLLALRCGDVSVATPLLGTKVILVAFLTMAVLSQPVSLELWTGAFMAMFAFVLLRGPKGQTRTRYVPTFFYSLACSASFALCDILIQKWAPLYGAGAFLMYMFGMIAFLSLGFIPFFPKPPLSYPSATWKWLFFGVVFIALQAVGMAIALGYYGNATATNIVFSSRGIWSVLIVWRFGDWFNNREKFFGKSVMFGRLAGSVLLFAAIVLVIIRG
jgi:drug/metabolite transporter (DMT)-like permease